MSRTAESAIDRAELLELLARYASIPDTNDWVELPTTVFTDEILWDFESLNGEPARVVSRSVVMSELAAGFAAFEATHHATTNHIVTVDGDVATIRAHIRAEHWLRRDLVPSGDNRWTVVGFYDDEAIRTPDGWRLRAVRLSVTHRENDHLVAAPPADEEEEEE